MCFAAAGHALLHDYEYDHLEASRAAVRVLRDAIDAACADMATRCPRTADQA
jgi:hypothetical protein